MIESFKNKNTNNYSKNLLELLSFDNLYNNTQSNINENNSNNMNKNNSEFSLTEQINEKNEDKKKIISDNKILELYDNNPNDNNEKLIPPKFSYFSSSSLNNLGGLDQYSSIYYEPFNRLTSNNFDSNLNLNKFPNLSSTTLINPTPSFTNINKNILSPQRINQRDIFNYYNNIKSSNSNLINNSNNNLIQINPDICTKKTLLSPPPPINNYTFPSLTNIANPQPIIPSINRQNLNNSIFSTSINEKNVLKENEKTSSTLNMFNKKRKRDIKNNKLVFISGDNKSSISKSLNI